MRAWWQLDLADVDGDGTRWEPVPLDLNRLPRVVGPLGCERMEMGAFEFPFSLGSCP